MNPLVPSGGSPPPPPASAPLVWPMHILAAVLWATLLVLMSMALLLPAMAIGAFTAVPAQGFLAAFGCQFIATVFIVVLIRRVHAPEIPIRELVGVRATHPGFYVLALVLAVAVQLTAGMLYSAILSRFPTSIAEEHQLPVIFARSNAALRVLLGSIIVGFGPLIEEVFYRGAIFTPLCKRYRAPLVIVTTSVLFAVVHAEWQMFLPIGIAGIAMGLMRSASGSLLPSLLLHAAFNGTTLLAGGIGDRSGAASAEPTPLGLILMPSMVTLLLLGYVHRLGQTSALAREAQRKDER